MGLVVFVLDLGMTAASLELPPGTVQRVDRGAHK
jgi:hypothetical protein